jgi:hypothetical protein
LGVSSSFFLFALAACNPSGGDGGNTPGPSGIGPEGGIIDYDASAIPAPWDDAATRPAEGDGDISSDGSGWIADGAGDEYVPTCTGVPTDCSLAADCASVRGCTQQGSCDGTPHFCFDQIGDITCISIRGCYWDSTTNSCAGVSAPCNEFIASPTCFGQPGCRWTPTCGGTPTPCSLIPVATCTTQPGCVLL